jgi:hypothetical protein
MKHKYEVGTEVFIRFLIERQDYDEEMPYYEANMVGVPKNHDEGPWTIPEVWIDSVAPVVVPEKVGTVVIAGGMSWVLTDDEETWYSAKANLERVWEALCVMGRPKVIWTPDETS